MQQEKIRIGENTIIYYKTKIYESKKNLNNQEQNMQRQNEIVENTPIEERKRKQEKLEHKKHRGKREKQREEGVKDSKKQNTKIGMVPVLLILIFAILTILAIKMEKSILTGIGIGVTTLSVIVLSYQQYRKKSEYHTTKQTQNVDNENFHTQMSIMQTTLEKLQKEQEMLKTKVKQEYDNCLETLQNEYLGKLPVIEIQKQLTASQIGEQIEFLEHKISQDKLKIQSILLDQNNILSQLENLANLEEEYTDLNERYQALMLQNEAIELAKQELENAYGEMKKKVTPNFTGHLSNIMKNISNGAYTNIRLDEKDGMMIETNNRKLHTSRLPKHRNHRPTILILKTRSRKPNDERKFTNYAR